MVNKESVVDRPEKTYDIEVIDQIHRHYVTTAYSKQEAEKKIENMIRGVDYLSELDKTSTNSELRYRNYKVKTIVKNSTESTVVNSTVWVNIHFDLDDVTVKVTGDDGHGENQSIVNQLIDCSVENPERFTLGLMPSVCISYESDEYRGVKGDHVSVWDEERQMDLYESIGKALLRHAEQRRKYIIQREDDEEDE